METYVARARRLGINPTEECIACGGEPVVQLAPVGAGSGHRFCKKHLDWERAAEAACRECPYAVQLTCSHGITREADDG